MILHLTINLMENLNHWSSINLDHTSTINLEHSSTINLDPSSHNKSQSFINETETCFKSTNKSYGKS
jgi:hypothetical protein